MDYWEIARPLDEPWYYQAACQGQYTELWFLDAREYRGGMPAGDEAKRICNTVCTVKDICLAEALVEEKDQHIRYGVRGGMTGKERDRLVESLRKHRRRVA